MKEIPEYEKDLASIRSMMERSVKFLSLSGLAGVLAGLYALGGSWVAYRLLSGDQSAEPGALVLPLLIAALVVLVLSLSTGYLFAVRKAGKLGVPVWGPGSRQLLNDISYPLISGGLFILVMISHGYFGVVAPSCLIFYGLALMAGGRHTYDEIRYLGLSEIALGMICAWYPGYGLLAWAGGFGILHIVYGGIMYFRYDR